MECTQRLECTQDLYETNTEKLCPDQIGFLGILGAKHPIVKGPNKIGRDPSTCQIVLNMNSVSRQHAVLNVLSSKEYMLMDLDSANKTKLLNKTLRPYIPQPLKNGDTVQFGDIFGIFRLLEEDEDLPMTQALDIPDTPVPSKFVSKLCKAPTTMIPESPEVSDREESFIAPSQPKEKVKLSNSQIINPFGKTLSIHPISSKASKDNSRRPNSSNTSNTSLNDSFLALQCDKSAIHEMDTQIPEANTSIDSIYNAATQLPSLTTPIHDLDTQVPNNHLPPLHTPIHDLHTQLPFNHLPQVQKAKMQQELQQDVYNNKENDISIFNAETQLFLYDKNDSIDKANVKCKDDDIFNAETQPFAYDKPTTNELKELEKSTESTKSKLNTSEEELLFDDIDDELIEDCNSQAILPSELPIFEAPTVPSVSPKIDANKKLSIQKLGTEIPKDIDTDCEDFDMTQKVLELPTTEAKPRTTRIKSNDSTDCEDIELQQTQKVEEIITNKASKRINRIDSDSSTDCEEIIPQQKVVEKDEDLTDCEDDVIEPNVGKTVETKSDVILLDDDMATQIVDVDKEALEDIPTQIIVPPNNNENVSFEDQPTQVIDEIVPNCSKKVTPFDSQFKVPFQSPRRAKKDTKTPIDLKVRNKLDGDDNYYKYTQDIYDDLCSQRPESPIIGQTSPLKIKKVDLKKSDDFVPSSVEEFIVGDRFANIELSPNNSFSEDKVKKYVSNLSNSQVQDVIGVAKPKKFPSDSSDVESTPKKVRPFIFTDSDLPSSQEIKTSLHPRTSVTESSSDSEPENNSEEQYTPFLHRAKKAPKAAKKVIVKKLDIDKLPERVITRKRKPTAKIIENNAEKNKITPSLLKPKFLTEQEDQIDSDIITENIKRLKTYEKGKSKESKDETYKEEKKEKIKVKVGRPRKDAAKSTKPKDNTSRKSNDDSQDKSVDKLETTSSSTTSTRSTRNRRKPETESVTEIIKEPEEKQKRTYRKRNKSKSPVRRSKRQTAKTNKETEKEEEKKNTEELTIELKAPKSILKKSIHEQSTVYNISSSSADSPKNLKRSLADNSIVPSPKRTRSYLSNNSVNNSVNSSINNTSLRATPARSIKTHHVLFTAFPSDEVRQKLENLGAVIVTDVLSCSVVLTMAVKRTFKLLCAMGLGRPIVGPSWVQACVDNNTIVDPWLYLIKDEAAEKRFQFSLERTLTGKRNFLKGYNISSTPSVQPNATEMKLIVECSGGIWKEGGSNWVCVTSTKDKSLWPFVKKRGATIVSTEFILGGVLRQKLEITPNEFK